MQHLSAFNAHRNRLSIIAIKRNVAAILTVRNLRFICSFPLYDNAPTQEKAAIEKGKPAERQHKPAAEEAKPKKEAELAAPAAAAKEAPAPAAAAEAKGKKEKPAAKGPAEPKAAKGKQGGGKVH